MTAFISCWDSVFHLIVASISIVVRVSMPTIAAMSMPPFRMKLCLYFEAAMRSKKRSIIKFRRMTSVPTFDFFRKVADKGL